MPGTHRTPDVTVPDIFRFPPHDAWRLEVAGIRYGVQVTTWDGDDAVGVQVPPDALPALVAALASHLTVDARRALTRNLAAQDGDAVTPANDTERVRHQAVEFLHMTKGWDDHERNVHQRVRLGVEAAGPTPTQGGDRG